MKHYPKASPPYFEVAPGVRVEYPGTDLDDDTGPDCISVRVDGKELGSLWVCSDPEAEELQAVYDKGREDERQKSAGALPRHRTEAEVVAALDGATIAGAAVVLGCATSSVNRLRMKYGLPPRPRGGWQTDRVARESRVRSAMESSATYREAGEKLGGVTRQRAKQLGLRFSVTPGKDISSLMASLRDDWAAWLDVLSPSDVATLLGLSGAARYRVVAGRNRLVGALLPLRQRARARAVLALWRDGWRQTVISGTVGTVQGNVSRIIVKARTGSP